MKKTLTPVFIILAGIIIFLANTNVFNMGNVMEVWWSAALIIIALLMVDKDPRHIIWPLLLGGCGVVLLLNNLKVTSVDMSAVIIPAILIAVGVSMLVRRHGGPRAASSQQQEELIAILSGTESTNVSKDYEGSAITTILGGVELDLSKATIKKDAHIDATVILGGVTIRVAENVVVKNCSTTILGGFEDKTRPHTERDLPTLYIDGTIVMGGIEIKR